MTEEDYREILKPATDSAIRLFMSFEPKYGEGITFKNDDLIKCARHALSAHMGEDNPDGESHAVAALSRAYCALLAEIT